MSFEERESFFLDAQDIEAAKEIIRRAAAVLKELDDLKEEASGKARYCIRQEENAAFGHRYMQSGLSPISQMRAQALRHDAPHPANQITGGLAGIFGF